MKGAGLLYAPAGDQPRQRWLAVIAVMMIGLFGAVPGGFVPEEDEGYLLVNVQLPDAASLERTTGRRARSRTILEDIEGVEYGHRPSPVTAC